MNYTGKHVLITGGSSGIGFALASILVKSGANVCLIARDQVKLELAQKKLSSFKSSSIQIIQTISADVSIPDDIIPKLNQYLAISPHPDYLINSAGVVHPGIFEDLPIERFAWMSNINYLGTVYTTKAVIPWMISKKSGHIVNISSIAGYLGTYGYTAYCGSKFAVRGFSDALRSEIKTHNIRVSIAFPPDTQTPQLDYETPFKPAITKELSGEKPLSPEYVAKVILQDVYRGKYWITPGFDSTFYLFLQNLLGELSYPLMDFMIANAARKVTKLASQEK